MTQVAWLNGVFLAREEARISPMDRGFLFGDSVYEVTAVVGGKPIDMERHLDRLERSLRELRFPVLPDRAEVEAAHKRLIADNGLTEGLIYLQVTRGAYAGRDFFPPPAEKTRLTLFAFADARPVVDTAAGRDGIGIAFQPDIRWERCDIKTTQLLAATLAKQAANESGAQDAWFVDADGRVTEGASSNAWIVTRNGELVTRALTNAILPGVTRHAILDAIKGVGSNAAGSGPLVGDAVGARFTLVERSFTVEEAKSAAEAFLTGAGSLIFPVVRMDGAPVGDGKPGPVTRLLQGAYFKEIGAGLPDWVK